MQWDIQWPDLAFNFQVKKSLIFKNLRLTVSSWKWNSWRCLPQYKRFHLMLHINCSVQCLQTLWPSTIQVYYNWGYWKIIFFFRYFILVSSIGFVTVVYLTSVISASSYGYIFRYEILSIGQVEIRARFMVIWKFI